LPGTTGWGTTFGGIQTALWQPQIQTNDGSFGVQSNGFGFDITWASGMTVVVEACTNLVNPSWFPVETNFLNNGSFYFRDSSWTNYPVRFYRLSSQISLAQIPGPPTLYISRSGSPATISVYWQDVLGWSLQQNNNLTVPAEWSYSSGVTTSNGTNYLTLRSPTGNLFFRLSNP